MEVIKMKNTNEKTILEKIWDHKMEIIYTINAVGMIALGAKTIYNQGYKRGTIDTHECINRICEEDQIGVLNKEGLIDVVSFNYPEVHKR